MYNHLNDFITMYKLQICEPFDFLSLNGTNTVSVSKIRDISDREAIYMCEKGDLDPVRDVYLYFACRHWGVSLKNLDTEGYVVVGVGVINGIEPPDLLSLSSEEILKKSNYKYIGSLMRWYSILK